MAILAAASNGIASVSKAPERWSAVYAMALCTFALIASEFMPVSLLSPIARTLALTDGQAGQAIAVSGIFAVVASLSVTSLLGAVDRRAVMLGLTALLAVSDAVVAFAPTYEILMAGRALLGVAIGGFWSMSTAVVMRLVPERSVAKALAVVNGGNALATVVAAPLGSLMGGLVGWRGAFFCVVPIAVAALAWQAASIPALAAEEAKGKGGMRTLIARPAISLGLGAVALLFVGQFALFTYLRPFLEQVTGVNLPTLSALLLVVGVAGFAGTLAIGRVVEGGLGRTLAGIPLAMTATAGLLALFGGSTAIAAVLLAVWGFVGTAAPVAWWTWLARTAPDRAEAGGGLMVAVIQLAITLGAAIGGATFDAAGPRIEFATSGVVLLAAAVVAILASRSVTDRSMM